MANRNKHSWKIRLEKKGDDELLFCVKGLRQIIHLPRLAILTFVYWVYEHLRILF